jgi:hypothetical protein
VATSQNGFPAVPVGHPTLHKWIIPGTDRYFVLRYGSAGFILAHFILWYHERVHALNEKGQVWDEWAYAYRPVRGDSSTLSNHASGTAVDLNATLYPLGLERMLSWRKIKIRARLAFYRGTLRWGGNYTGRKDEMHVEIDKPLSACERRAKRLLKTPRGKRILKANPGQDRIIYS